MKDQELVQWHGLLVQRVARLQRSPLPQEHEGRLVATAWSQVLEAQPLVTPLAGGRGAKSEVGLGAMGQEAPCSSLWWRGGFGEARAASRSLHGTPEADDVGLQRPDPNLGEDWEREASLQRAGTAVADDRQGQVGLGVGTGDEGSGDEAAREGEGATLEGFT